MPEKPRKLTPLQLRFVEAYLVSRNASSAAREAGYASSCARTHGAKLLTFPHVAEALRARGLEPPRGVHPATQTRKRRVNPPRDGLTLREQRFVFAYLACGNASEAARRIGIGAKAARLAGARLLQRPLVAAFIAKERAALVTRSRIDAGRVLQELARIAFADIREIADWSEEDIVFKPSTALSADAGAAIAELDTKPSRGGMKTTLRLHSKADALETLARILGLFTKPGPHPGGASHAATPQAGTPKRSPEEVLRFLLGEEGREGETEKPGS